VRNLQVATTAFPCERGRGRGSKKDVYGRRLRAKSRDRQDAAERGLSTANCARRSAASSREKNSAILYHAQREIRWHNNGHPDRI
jgi:hypothetical protein